MPKLFIDTHSETVTIAILDGSNTLRKEATSNRSHSEVVVPLLDEILKEAKLELKDIKEIIVVNGPGSFTGVRIGVTIAKTIAYSLSTPIKTITSLEMYGVSSNEEFDLVTIADSKGIYSARREGNGYTDYMYQRRADFDNYVETNGYKVLEGKTIDLDKVLAYMENKECTNSHKVNPIYIKEIDALK